MTRIIEIPLYQQLVNKVNHKKPFTHLLSKSTKRYIVSTKSIYKGRNPSLWFESIIKIKSILDNKNQLKNIYSSFGGYLDVNNNYHLDFNNDFDCLEVALRIANKNNQEAIYDIEKDKIIFLKL